MVFSEFCEIVCQLADDKSEELVDLFDYFEFSENGKVAIDRNPVLSVIYYREKKFAMDLNTNETSILNDRFWESLDCYFNEKKGERTK